MSRVTWLSEVVTTAYAPTKSLHDVVPQVRPQFEALLAHATELGLKPTIRSAGRTCEQQAEQVKGGFSSAELCRSMHVFGHAVDLDLTPNDCATHTKLGTWWEARGGVWGGRWTGAKFGPCGDMGHYHFGFGGAGAVPTSACPSGVTLEQCQKLREEYLDRAHAAGPGVSSGTGLLGAVAVVGAAVGLLWLAVSVKPGRLAAPGLRENPRSVVLYHGTNEEWARLILAQGFRRRYVGEHGREWVVGSALKLTLTDSIGVARYYAAARAFEEGDRRGAVLSVHVDPSCLRTDEWGYYFLNLKRSEKVAVPDPRDWRRSLSEIGAVVCEDVPPKNVKLREWVTARKRDRIRDARPLVREALRAT